ncbi:MAG: SgcJ/EcaC family oxidoreductase [Burkholderiales bacterium]
MKRHINVMLLLILFGAVFSSWAGSKEDVAAATAKWAEVFTDDNPDKILALYAKDGVLWGTLSPKRRDDPEAIKDYFVKAFAALPSHKVSFGDQLIRVYGNTAVNTGYYTFTYVKDGEAKSLPARYSFTYVKKGKKWLIVDHHSSAMPAPPK